MRGLNFIAPAFAVVALSTALSGTASAGSDPTGIWMNDTGRGAVEIKHCGDAVCGTVVWTKNSADADGCGKQIMGDVAPVGGGVWDNGWIYDPERGRKFDVELTPLNDGTLRVMGYAGMKFLSKTMIWKKAPQDLQLCGQEAKVEPPATVKPDVAPIAAAAPAPIEAPAAAPAKPAVSEATEKPAPAAEPAPAPAASAKAETKPTEAAPAPTAKAEAPAAKADKEDKTASSNDNGGNDIGKALKNLKLGDLDMDKVITRSNGKCNINTPWFKVVVNCEQ